MARRGVPNEDLSNIEFETSEEVEVVPTFNSMVCQTQSGASHFYISFSAEWLDATFKIN